MGMFLFNFCTIFFLYSIFYFQYEFMFLWCIIWEREHKLKILNLRVFSSRLVYAVCFWANFLVPCVLKLRSKLAAVMRAIVLLVFL